MTTTPPEAPAGPPPPGGPQTGPHTGPRATRDQVRDLGRLRRTTSTDKKVAGVAGGIARHLDVDPLLVRVLLVVLVFFGGAGLLVYAACWLVVPEEATGRARLQLDDRSRSVALVVVGVLALASFLGDSWGFVDVPWLVVLVAGVVLYLLTRGPAATAAPPAGPYGPYGPAAPAWQQGPVPGPAHGPLQDGPVHGPVQGPPATPPHPGYEPPQPPWPGPAPAWPVPAVPLRNPRKRGPVLFWATAALAVLASGLLGLAAGSGLDVTPSAYPAVVVATCGVMLVVGSVWGRAGGLTAVGVLAAAAMTITSVADDWDAAVIDERPQSAAAVQPSYAIGLGELRLDLSDVDPATLDGRRIELSADVGEIEVVVPDGIDVEVTAQIDGVGESRLFGRDRDGFDNTVTGSHDGGAGAPVLRLDAQLDVGEIIVRTEGSPR